MPNSRTSAFLEHTIGVTSTLSRTFSTNTDTLTEEHSELSFSLAALAVNVKVDLCDVTNIQILFIESDSPISITFDTITNVQIPIENVVLLATNITVGANTGLYLTNPNNLPAILKITALGI